MSQIRPPGRPRTPEGDLNDPQRRKRERWRAYSAARYESQRPQREAARLAREALKPNRPAVSANRSGRRKAADKRPGLIPAGDTRPW